MSKTAHVLSSILERSGIDRKLGHPLYLYRITSNELASLREALLSAVENQGELKWPEDCAAFCLFGAEWFRHNYEDGVWSWDTIYSGLGWREHAIERLKPNVTKIVAKGLKWWGLEVIRLELSRRFLATLVCQGGLPIHSLRRDGGSLARFLKASLRVHERYSSVPIVQVIEEQAYILPLSFQNPDFLNLAGRLIDTVSKLRALSDRYSESGVSRKEYLDRNQPDWALSLPLRIEESESLSLVVSLLDESKAKLIPDGQFAISTRLEQPETLARLVREVEFPSVLTPDELRRHFLVDPSIELYPRLLVFLNCGGKQTPCLSVVLNRDGASYRLAKQERTSTSISGATDFIRLVLKFSGEEIGQCVPVGSDEMPDSPWTFTDREPNPLIGIGGVKSRENSVLIALPAENTLEVITGQHSFLETLVHGRRIVRLSGESVVRSIDGICRIISKSIDINSAIFELRGKQLRLGESHEYVWIGAPTIDEILLDENGNRRSVPEFQMEWRPQRNSGWRRLSGACLGDVVLRVVSNGEVKFLCRTKVFPSDFTLSIKPDVNSASSGRIELRNLGSASIDFENSNDVITTVAFAGRLHCVSVKVHGEHPGSLRCRIRFSPQTECDVSLICPTTSIRIVDAANRPLPPKSLIPVDQLGGVTLRVVQPDHRAVAVYEIDNWQFLETTHLTKLGSVSELNLSSISTYAAGVLAQSDDPDSKVKFGVVLGNTSTPVFEWSVSRYSRYLKKDDQDIERGISVDSTFFSLPKDFAARLKEDHDEVVLDVLPMHAVSQPMPKASIASTGDGVFRIDHADYQPGYYLIVGHTKNSGETVRPIRLAVKPNTIPRPDMKDLLPSEKFSAVLNLRSRDGRKLAWADFCGELGGDLAHPAWENVDEILNISKSLSLPITTFEVLAQLASTPEAIVRTAFVRHSDVWFWESMEQIPFLWSLVPTAHWIKGAYRSIEFVSKTLNNVATDPVEIEKLIATQIRMFAESAPIRVRGLASVLPALRDAGIDVPIQVLGQHYDRNPVGSRDIEMARLIKQHEKYGARHSLPEIRLMLAELVHEKLRCIVDLTIQDRISNGWSVLNAPAIAAIHCMYDLVAPVELVCQLKRLRGIDPEWFSIANASAMQMIFEHRMREDPTCFSRLSDTVK